MVGSSSLYFQTSRMKLGEDETSHLGNCCCSGPSLSCHSEAHPLYMWVMDLWGRMLLVQWVSPSEMGGLVNGVVSFSPLKFIIMWGFLFVCLF